MSLYTLRQYLKHRWLAKGRHGTHSPFVYNLVDKGLTFPWRFRSVGADGSISLAPSNPENRITGRLLRFFNVQHLANFSDELERLCSCWEVSVAGGVLTQRFDATATSLLRKALKAGEAAAPAPDIIHLFAGTGSVLPLFEKALPAIGTNTVVLVAGIHGSPQASADWETLCGHPRVKMSLDFFHTGVLLFRPEFLERQHFILKD